MMQKKTFGKRRQPGGAFSQDANISPNIYIIGAGMMLGGAAMGWLLVGRYSHVVADIGAPTVSSTKPKNICGLGNGVGIAQDNWVGVRQVTRLRSSPLMDANDIINEKATKTLGRTEYHETSRGETLHEKCRFGEWSQVNILEPYWLREIGGWVPTTTLRSFETANGRRIYVASDLYWIGELRRYDQNTVLSALNLVIQRDASCPVFDPETVSVSSRYGGPDDPILFVTCQTPSRQAYNVFFDLRGVSYDYK